MLCSYDVFDSVCRELTSLRHLGLLARTSRATNAYLKMSGEQWALAGERVYGEWWPELRTSKRAADVRYSVMLRVCPWVSEPQRVEVREFQVIRRRGGTYRVHRLRLVDDKCVLSCTRTIEGRKTRISVVVPPYAKPVYYCLVRARWTEDEVLSACMSEGDQAYTKQLMDAFWHPPAPFHTRMVHCARFVHAGLLCVVCSSPVVRAANGPVTVCFVRRQTLEVLRMMHFPRGARSLPKCIVVDCGEMWILSEEGQAVLYFGPRADRAVSQAE